MASSFIGKLHRINAEKGCAVQIADLAACMAIRRTTGPLRGNGSGYDAKSVYYDWR
jgi:molybdenum cofactor biosynthesis enzyme